MYQRLANLISPPVIRQTPLTPLSNNLAAQLLPTRSHILSLQEASVPCLPIPHLPFPSMTYAICLPPLHFNFCCHFAAPAQPHQKNLRCLKRPCPENNVSQLRRQSQNQTAPDCHCHKRPLFHLILLPAPEVQLLRRCQGCPVNNLQHQ